MQDSDVLSSTERRERRRRWRRGRSKNARTAWNFIREMEKQAEVHSESVEDRKGFEKKMKVDGWK